MKLRTYGEECCEKVEQNRRDQIIVKKMAKLEKKLSKYKLNQTLSGTSSSEDKKIRRRYSRGCRSRSRSRGRRYVHHHHGRRYSEGHSGGESSDSGSGSSSAKDRHLRKIQHGHPRSLSRRSRSFVAHPWTDRSACPWGRYQRRPLEQPHHRGSHDNHCKQHDRYHHPQEMVESCTDEDLAVKWTEILKKGLPNEMRKTLISKFTNPESANFNLLFETLNISTSECEELGAGLAALNQALTNLEPKIAKDEDLADVYNTLNQAAELIIDVCHSKSHDSGDSSESCRQTEPLSNIVDLTVDQEEEKVEKN